MKTSFYGNLSIVTVAHFIGLAALLLGSFVLGLFETKREAFVPVNIQFVAPQSMIKNVKRDAPQPPKDTDVVMPVKSAPQKKKESPKAVTNSLPRFVNPPKGKQPPLSIEQIKKLLLAGAKPGSINVVPDDDTLEKQIVKQRFYDAWSQPSKTDVGNAQVEALITLGSDGTVLTRMIRKKAGIQVMNESVEQALKAVDRIDGLSSKFIENNKEISITFMVE